ncbi:sensor domain-containing diguanylate cyclase [Devosia chinhatensis]|uniref:diguanylate cyclase n=1 Tax=Devosia chinhatensis TaxID=429727 RepID=A0A0F5FH49_9HYPH|nr:sensor domain-containing diguanylate cyclase [Devosia chinhatensis]KKB07915.1 hypothetical protein VE26_14960 [Devosia chinhatensis]
MSSATRIDRQNADAESQRLAALARYDILDTPPEPAFERIARLVELVFGVQSSAVSLIDAHRQWIKASRGVPVREAALDDTFCRITLRRNEALVVPDLSLDQRFRDNPFVTGETAIRFYAGVPIRTADGHTIGTVCAMDQRPRPFSERDVMILTELAEIVMNEIELRQLATTDGLTGLSTRRAFKEEAERFLALARRHRTALSVVCFDIDHFKTVNDTHGHAAGDAVLKAVAETAARTPRESDLLGRLGGEEFALLVPGADAGSSIAIAEKLRQRIAALSFAHIAPGLRVTASFGVAGLDPDRDDLEALLAKADVALYEAKRSGRDRVTTFKSEAAPSLPVTDRQRQLSPGKLVLSGSDADAGEAVDCTIRAVWDEGAEVQVSAPDRLPERLTLVLPGLDTSWPARILSRRGGRIELGFC